MRAAVVTVGDELLAGEVRDTNSGWLCARLADRGVRTERVTTVPDRAGDIARVVNEHRAAYDAVLVTGGLGPTPDDVTMAAVGAALGREVVVHEDALADVRERGYDSDGTAFARLPEGARFLPNDRGVAPGAVVDSVYVLPGVPAEMRAMFERVESEFSGEMVTKRVVADESESALLERIEAACTRFDVDVGTSLGDAVTLHVRGEDADEVAAAATWLRERVDAL